MRLRVLLVPTALAVMLGAPSAASASFVHTVGPGESLYSIAAADGLTVSQLAAANGLSSASSLTAGSAVQIPSQTSSSVAGSASSAGSACDGDGDSDDVGCGAAAAPTCDGDGDSDDVGCGSSSAPTSVSTSSAGGSYVVQPGDTLTAIAARAGLSPSSLAAANGLSRNGVLVAGTALRLSGTPSSLPTTSSTVAASQPVGTAAQGSPVSPPYPTSQRVSPSEVGQVAAAGGVSPSLAQAIADQESGFNNAAVSSADARGVMQILPGTWEYIQHSLIPGAPPLAPASAVDNVRGGVALLRSLLNATGGNSAMAAAGYYQGLPSVQKYGLYPDTQRYVQSVMALRSRFAGGG